MRMPWLPAEIPFRQVLKFDSEVFHAGAHLLDSCSEHVVEDGRRYSRGETDSGGDERFGNTGRDRAQTGAARIAQARECIDNSPDGAEQAYKWRDGSNRR